MSLIRIQGVKGAQFDRLESTYPNANLQYATTSYQKDHNMWPNLVVQPVDEEDIKKTVKWARDEGRAVSVKSGGHQYSGASSTGGSGIQLDLTNTFKNFEVLPVTVPIPDDRAMVLIGVSNTMQELNKHLQDARLFVPTGQCAYVGVGGHGQTGGYGQLGRSFGLFGDQIRFIRMIDCNGESQEVSKQTDPELFYAILGGSPGNFCIITHFISEVFKSDSYLGTVPFPSNGFKGPHGIKAYWLYSHQTLVDSLTEVAKMADNPNLPRGFDLCVSVYSQDSVVADRFNDQTDAATWQRVREQIREVFKDKPEYLKSLGDAIPPYVIIYAQWCPTPGDDKYNQFVDDWFKNFRTINDRLVPLKQSLVFAEFDMPMADITHQWLMLKRREFDLPYVKRAYSTTSTTLTKDDNKWAKTVADRVDLLYNPKYFHARAGSHAQELFSRVKVVLQIQAFNGNNSMYVRNKDNGTSYTWRDTSVVQVMDTFYEWDRESEKYAEEWQAENDKVMIGPNSVFSKDDRRFLWGSHGDWNMKDEKVWRCYYENKEKYQRLGKARGKADPKGTFTPNPFAVEALR